MIKQVVGIAGGGLILLSLLGKLGIDTKKFLNLNNFAKDADFSLNKVHGFHISGGMKGDADFLVDINVLNKSTSDVLMTNLLIVAYNEKGQFIGQSTPYSQKIIIKESSTTLIPNVQVAIKLSSALFDYTLPMLLKMIQNKTWQTQPLGKTIKLNISMELNGIKVTKNVNYKI